MEPMGRHLKPKSELYKHMGGCQNYGPFLGTLNIRCRIIIRTQKGTLILTTTHMEPQGKSESLWLRALLLVQHPRGTKLPFVII